MVIFQHAYAHVETSSIRFPNLVPVLWRNLTPGMENGALCSSALQAEKPAFHCKLNAQSKAPNNKHGQINFVLVLLPDHLHHKNIKQHPIQPHWPDPKLLNRNRPCDRHPLDHLRVFCPVWAWRVAKGIQLGSDWAGNTDLVENGL